MLEKLFTSKARIKLLQFFLIEGGSGAVREISRKIDAPVSAVAKELRNLSELNIISKEGSYFKANPSCRILNDLKGILVKTDSVAFPIKKSLHGIDAEFILIFGSFARGDYVPESDIDLMIIGNAKSSNVYKILKPAESLIERDVNPIVWSMKHFRSQSGKALLKDIIKKGFIMLKGNENEFRKIAERKKD